MPTYVCLNKQTQKIDKYSLVPLRYEDRFHIMKWRNEQIYHLRQVKPLTEKDQQAYFDNVISKLFSNPKPEQVLFSYLEDDICIGYGGLVHINWEDYNAEISFIIDTKLEKTHFSHHWSTFLSMLVRIAFEELNLHKVYTYAFDIRPHLYEVLESNGFKREAILEDHCIYQNEYKNVVVHSLINK